VFHPAKHVLYPHSNTADLLVVNLIFITQWGVSIRFEHREIFEIALELDVFVGLRFIGAIT
jgi:hypothetical protein